MIKWPGHLAISASAGTGKTYRLAHRFIQLVMFGEEPERIVALTFSRKAAGEIFDRVVAFLIKAASSEAEAAGMNDRIGFEAGDPEAYRLALRKLLEALPRSRVGTIDSFTVGIVRSFPYELGLDPDFSVFDGDGLDARHYRNQALRYVLQNASATEGERKAFLKTFNDATFGHEEKQAGGILEQLVKNYQQLYRLQPDAGHWGLPVQPSGTSIKVDGLSGAVSHFLEAVETLSLQTTPHTYFTEFCEELQEWSPESILPKRMAYMLAKLEPHYNELGNRAVMLKLNRDSFTLDEVVGGMLRDLIAYIVENVIHLANYRTAGLHRIIERYEEAYDEQVRRRGFLTFDDALYSLLGHRLVSGAADISDDPARLAINYRLDGRLDHWLLDEFQDTSTMQWQVMSSLVDEVLQDTEQRRTFFYVGDVKQAIYAWRGGNAELFEQIRKHYNASEEAIALEFSNVSYRSAPPIIDTVNAVFSNLPTEFCADAVARWKTSWQTHECCSEKKDADGYVAFTELERGYVDGESENTRRLMAAVEIIAEIDPVKRGLTAAILTRDNRSAWAVAERMRAEHPDIPVALEGKSHIADNPAVSLMMSLLQWASHPGDLFALRHLQMSPLAHTVSFVMDDAAVPGQILAEIQGSGFHRTLTTWAGVLTSMQELSPYEAMRMQQLLELASAADRDVSRDIDRFVDQVREAAIEDAASRQSVRIMTIHKSKGLDFDVVVLPNLQGGGGGGTRALVNWNEDRSMPEWILQHINKEFINFDDRLQSCAQKSDTRDKYEELCVLYVAMTRAARALYMVSTRPAEKSVAKSHAMILNNTLRDDAEGATVSYGDVEAGLVYESGNRNWYEKIPVVDIGKEAKEESLPKLTFKSKSEERSMPSAGGEFERNAGQVFGTGLRESREFGSAVHAVFEKIEWLDDSSDLTDPLNQAAVVHVEECLKAEEIAALLSRPNEPCEVWREQSFEVMLDGEWVSGVFDRVVIYRDENGKAARADIIDYKTNRIHDGEHLKESAGHYRSQLKTYREALSLLTGIEPQAITMKLVFTDAARVVEI